MSRKEILEFLIQTMNIQIIDEFKTTDYKPYIMNCIEAKRWLFQQLNGKDDLISALDCADDIDKYIKEIK